MKELPDKIYATPNFDRRWQTNAIDDESVEYIRTDAFIEKAVIWISNNCYIPHSTLENFRKYMKGE